MVLKAIQRLKTNIQVVILKLFYVLQKRISDLIDLALERKHHKLNS